MLAGLPVPDHAVEGLAELVRAAGGKDLADRLELAVSDAVALLRSRSTSGLSSWPRSKTHLPGRLTNPHQAPPAPQQRPRLTQPGALRLSSVVRKSY